MATPNHSVTLPFQARSRRRLLWCLAVLIALMMLLEFNPLHPIIWAHQVRESYEQGAQAGLKMKREREARRAVQTRP